MAPASPGVQDDASIPNEVDLLRSFSPKFIANIEGGGVRTSRQAFQKIKDPKDPVTGEKAMSVYRADILDDAGTPRVAIVATRPDHLIVGIPTWKYRDCGLGIVT